MFGSEHFTTFALLCCTRLRSMLFHAEMSSTSVAQRKISQAVPHSLVKIAPNLA